MTDTSTKQTKTLCNICGKSLWILCWSTGSSEFISQLKKYEVTGIIGNVIFVYIISRTASGGQDKYICLNFHSLSVCLDPNTATLSGETEWRYQMDVRKECRREQWQICFLACLVEEGKQVRTHEAHMREKKGDVLIVAFVFCSLFTQSDT